LTKQHPVVGGGFSNSVLLGIALFKKEMRSVGVASFPDGYYPEPCVTVKVTGKEFADASSVFSLYY
jgi:hypothetical protein